MELARATPRHWQRLIVAALVGLGLWFGLVVAPNDSEGTAFLWSSVLAAVALGLTTSTDGEAWLVGVGLAGPAFALALWTAPRGDNDGLWLLWLPILAGMMLPLTVAAWVAGLSVRTLRNRSGRA